MKIGRGWKAQDLVRREDLVEILTTNLSVVSHPPPDNMAGALYCVAGIASSADAIMDLLEMRALGQAERDEEGEDDGGRREERGARF